MTYANGKTQAPRKRPGNAWRAASTGLSAAAVLALAGLVWAPRPLPSAPVHAVTEAGEAITVVDGDTVDVGGQRFRLVGHDTPEIYHIGCPAERDAGILAAARLIALLREGEVRMVRVKGREKWGRGLARLEVGGADVGATLIAEGLARPYDGGKRRGWCD